LKDLARVVDMGIGSILVFGLVEGASKDASGTAAYDDRGAVQQAIRKIRKKFPDLVIASDVCVCAYTSHGHCGPLMESGDVDNDAANAILAKMAVSHAAAGADMVAPSAMMDGQVTAIRQALDAQGFQQTLLMSYSTKFASSMYGPFREAEESAPQKGDRRGYQSSFGDLRQALRESQFDEAEGADMLMLKPSLFYLDILARLRDQTDLPIAAYNVSGEYSMLIAAADRGWGDLGAMVRESTMALSRAGADLIISYWANRYDEIFRKG
jgi:porphobilinogen synthase